MGSKHTFLVVDDDPDTRYLNRHELQKWFSGCTVIEAASVEEALQCCETRRFDAVLTDHHLGQSDGAVFVAKLREREAKCPILMVTGNSDPKIHHRALAAGASRVFTPVDTKFGPYLKTLISPPGE